MFLLFSFSIWWAGGDVCVLRLVILCVSYTHPVHLHDGFDFWCDGAHSHFCCHRLNGRERDGLSIVCVSDSIDNVTAANSPWNFVSIAFLTVGARLQCRAFASRRPERHFLICFAISLWCKIARSWRKSSIFNLCEVFASCTATSDS